jgi:Fur family transcriptional regulator, ferric uptake regulator
MKNKEEAIKKFISYLKNNKLKVTHERKKILEEILKFHDHFDAESLYLKFKNENIDISRATVYRTLDLLVDCEILSRIKFSNNINQYEQIWGYAHHSHIICKNTGKVIEFIDDRIDQITKEIAEKYNLTDYKHNFKIYAVCNENEIPESNDK